MMSCVVFGEGASKMCTHLGATHLGGMDSMTMVK
jgi:hypothetical protein